MSFDLTASRNFVEPYVLVLLFMADVVELHWELDECTMVYDPPKGRSRIVAYPICPIPNLPFGSSQPAVEMFQFVPFRIPKIPRGRVTKLAGKFSLIGWFVPWTNFFNCQFCIWQNFFNCRRLIMGARHRMVEMYHTISISFYIHPGTLPHFHGIFEPKMVDFCCF